MSKVREAELDFWQNNREGLIKQWLLLSLRMAVQKFTLIPFFNQKDHRNSPDRRRDDQ